MEFKGGKMEELSDNKPIPVPDNPFDHFNDDLYGLKDDKYYGSTDFIGFSFNGIHSNDLGIIRVSDGSRYTSDLISNFQDKTAAVPGGDGTYFFDSSYTQRSFTINIAYDSMTEMQFRRMRQVFNGKDIGPLIFDELPYKQYIVKVQNPPQLKYICFYENGQRVYKGEGTIQFVCYEPYARSVKKFLDQYSNYNKSEWSASSGLRSSTESSKFMYDIECVPKGVDGSKWFLFNAGDVSTDIIIYFSINELLEYSADNWHIALFQDDEVFQDEDDVWTTHTTGEYKQSILNLSRLDAAKSPLDTYLRFNTKTNLIEGYSAEYKPTGTLYNDLVRSGTFFKIPRSEDGKYLMLESDIKIYAIDYSYLYY